MLRHLSQDNHSTFVSKVGYIRLLQECLTSRHHQRILGESKRFLVEVRQDPCLLCGFGLWSVRFPLVLVRTGRRLPVQALCERRVLVALTGYPRGGAPGPGGSFVTRATRNKREIWYMKSGPSRVNAPLGDL